MIPMRRIVPLVALAAFLAGCSNVAPCDEFAVPIDRKPSECPAKPKPVADPTKPKRYCYATLAQPDCFDQPQPGRSGFLGEVQP